MEQNVTEEHIRLWLALWKAHVPNKVKLFVWRALHNYVSSIVNMQIRGITLPSVTCTLCGELGEDVMHVLYKCSAAKEVWIRCGFGYLYEENSRDTLEDCCCMILGNSPLSWETFIMILWGLWTRRNKNFHGQPDGRDREVDVVVKHVLAEYHMANQKDMSRGAVQERKASIWAKAQLHHDKVNCDASWIKRVRKGGFGFCG